MQAMQEPLLEDESLCPYGQLEQLVVSCVKQEVPECPAPVPGQTQTFKSQHSDAEQTKIQEKEKKICR